MDKVRHIPTHDHHITHPPQITTTLPISIRAAIFHYIWDPRTAKEAFYAAGSPFYSDTPWLVHCTHSPCQCFRVDQLPLFTQHQIVGLPTAREAVAAYYAAMPPDRLGDDIELLKDFLARDHFHVGVVPAEHIRHLRITISPIECEILPMEINGNICMSSHGHAVVARELQHLDNLKHKDGFRLTVVLGKGIWGARAEKAMEAFRETYEGLRSEGVEFRVYGKASRAYYPVLRIDGYYGMKREKWYAFVEGQVKDKGEFQAECSDDEDGDERAVQGDRMTGVKEEKVE
jgi:hypothetical protein